MKFLKPQLDANATLVDGQGVMEAGGQEELQPLMARPTQQVVSATKNVKRSMDNGIAGLSETRLDELAAVRGLRYPWAHANNYTDSDAGRGHRCCADVLG